MLTPILNCVIIAFQDHIVRKIVVIKRLMTGFVVMAVAVAGVVAFQRSRDTESEKPVVDGRQASIKRGELLLSVGATGTIVPQTEVQLTFDLPGKVAQVWVEVGDSVERGDPLARVDATNLLFRVRQAEAALSAAQAQLDQLQAGPRREEVAAAEANLDAAEAGLDGARANLGELGRGPDEDQVETAEANLRAVEASVWLAAIQRDQIADGASAAEIAAAEAQLASALVQQKIARDTHDQTLKCQTVTLPDGRKQEVCPGLGTFEEQARYNLYAADEAVEAAQAQLDQLLAGPTKEQIDTGNANVAAAAAQRDAAQAQLDMLQVGATAEQLAAARANVTAFSAQRDAAQAQLDLLLAGASVYQIAAAQANVDQAQVTLETAQAELKKATLIAPFDGLVTAVNVQPEQTAPAALPALTLVDVSELRILVNVDEIDVARIVESQDVTIRVDALPGQAITGRVRRVSPAANQIGGVTVYQVTIALDNTDLPLRIGMSATASITIEELEDVLLVPNWAIRFDRETGRTFVNLLRGDQIDEVLVEIGVRGQDVSQVLSGLQAGDLVVAGEVSGLRNLLNQDN
jgi:HlyD family secretion protein